MTGSQSLDRGLDVLELVAEADGELGIREIGRRLGLAATIVQRLVSTLTLRSYLEQSMETRRYRIGSRALSLGQGTDLHARLLGLARAELKLLAERHQLNGFLGALRGQRAAYLLAVQSSGPITIRAIPGSDAPLHSTAMGKALLAGLTDETVAKLLPDPFSAVTERTITTTPALLADLQRVRATGHAVADEENLPGVLSVGAPILNAAGATVAALSVAFPKLLSPGLSLETVVPLITGAAERVSRALGWQPETDVPLRDEAA